MQGGRGTASPIALPRNLYLPASLRLGVVVSSFSPTDDRRSCLATFFVSQVEVLRSEPGREGSEGTRERGRKMKNGRV